MRTKKDFLKRALDLTTGDRNKTHGDAVQQHERAADLWTAYLGRRVDATDVCNLMILLKMSRHLSAPYNEDNFDDAVGYAAIAGECAEVAAREMASREQAIGKPRMVPGP